MKRTRFILLFSIFTISSLIGYLNGIKFGKVQANPNSQAMPFPIPPDQQFHLLLIQVDHFDNPDVVLKSVWILAHYTYSSRVDLIPIFPTNDINRNQKIADSFFLTENEGPSPDFWDQMETFRTWWNGYLLLDETATTQLVSFLSNQNPEEISLMLQNIPFWYQDANGAIENQTEMYDFAVQQIRQKDDYRGVIPLIAKLWNHADTNINYVEMVKTWQLLRSYGDSLTCSFPTLASSNP